MTPVKKQLEAGFKCLNRICPEPERKRRAAVAAEMVQRLANYRAFLADLDSDESCPGLRRQLADRAFEAEASLRILLAETVRTLNDLRDSGLLHPLLIDFGQRAGGRDDLPAQVGEAQKQIETEGKIFPDGLVNEVAASLERRMLKVTHKPGADVLVLDNGRSVAGLPPVTRVRLTSQAGDMGRIGLEDFFAASGSRGFHASQPIFVPPDCHHRVSPQIGSKDRDSIDAYGSILATLALARESMYRHARKVSEYGHGRTMLAVRDPVTEAAIGAVVAFVGLVVIGLAYSGVSLPAPRSYVVGFGVALLIAGIALFVVGVSQLSLAASE